MARRSKVADKEPVQRGARVSHSPDAQVASASGKKEKKTPAANDDLVNMALEIQESIRGAYRLHEEHRPVMLFHVQEERIYAHPYPDYKGTLSERSQAILEQQYKEAQRRDQIVVFVRDEATRRLVSLSIDYE
jgi:hypothetical protein